eukprot:SAG22_NODE_9349_length_594_cov_0.929293_2_plen_58_part_00
MAMPGKRLSVARAALALLCLAAAVGGTAAAGVGAAKLSEYTIVLAADASKEEQYAAR